MKAAQVTRYDKNNISVRIAEVEKPEPDRNSVLVKVTAAGVNPLDNMISRGEVKMIVPYRLPAIAGNELAGIVEKIGAASQNFKREIGCSPDCLWITLEHLQSM